MKKILIVEDDMALRNGIAARLRANGYATAVAMDGVSAVQVARRESPDLILLDIGLPGGDGFLVMSRLQQLMSTACTPIIVISARPAETHRDKAIQAGARAYFQKPFDNDQLLDTIADSLGVAA